MATGKLARRERQIVRVLTLLRLLREGGRPTIHDLAARFQTTRETIYRDLRVLEETGYPIRGDEEGRLSHPRLSADFRVAVPPIPFTKTEIASLLWAAEQAGSRIPFRAGLEGARLKLEGLAHGSGLRLAQALPTLFDGWSRGVKDYAACEAVLLDLVEAIVASRRCLVAYQAPGRSRPNRFRFDPYRILHVQGLLYCVGKVPVHDSLVTLAVDRLQAVTPTEESFTLDPAFDLKRYKAEAFGVMWEKPMTVVVRFRADQAPYVREREWHPTQRLRELPGGRLELTLRAGGTFEITRWLLGWGDAAEVVRPRSLRQALAATLAAAAGQYA